jgi:xylulokinase
MSHIIGCDLGSQSVKAVLVNESGDVAASASAPLNTDFANPGWASQDPRGWLTAAASAIRQAVTDAAVAPRDVEAIAFASQVDGVVAVDAKNEPLAPAIIWMDRRATAEAARLVERIGDEQLFRITGLQPDACHVAPKILWLQANDPDVRDGADAFLPPAGFVAASLSGRRVIDPANASSSMLFDVIAREWSEPLLEAARLRPELLGSVADAASVAGCLTEAASEQLGLTPGCRVMVGTGDDHGACLGAGVLRPGVVCDITGTAEPVAAVADAPAFDPERLVETHLHADARLWLIENPGFVSGGSTRWLADLFGISQSELAELAATAEPGSGGVTFLPALSGSMAPRWNPLARGVFSGVGLSHGRAELARAVFEGCTFALRDIVTRLDELGLAGGELRCVGGGARSPFWLQLKADITQRPVRVVEAREPTAMGAAMLASVGVGHARDLDEAASRLVRMSSRVHEPDSRLGSVYDDAYRRYRALYDAVEPTFGPVPR